jgi:hypothetical protein
MMDETTAGKGASQHFTSFPIGYYRLHPDVSVNFQLNRFYNWVGDAQMLAEIQAVAPGIKSYAVLTQTFLDLAEQALAQGHILKGAYYLRMAEFFLPATDARKQAIRKRFVHLVLEHYQVPPASHYRIPYESSWLSAYRFTPEQPKGTVLVFGGFDSYIEEWLLAAFAFYDARYDLILFEGPGQGTVLEEAHLPMTLEWEKPVRAVLDCFHLDDVTLMVFPSVEDWPSVRQHVNPGCGASSPTISYQTFLRST